jgi:hypothetical protein
MIVLTLIGFVGWLFFFDFAIKDGEVLEKYKDFLRTLPLYISKPLGMCIYCTAFWQFLIFYLVGMPMFIWAFGIVFLVLNLIEKWK